MQLTPDHIFAGRYRLISKIGMGGFSEVWKVSDQMAEDRIMVLKVYAPERGLDEHGTKQFRREYAITLDLNHPNLLKANHFDIADGSPYLVMPLCEGGSLYGRLEDNGPMPERELAEMLVQVADALEYLHRKEITHQDIKPDNVLIDSEGNYMLMDFGISSRLRSTMQKSTTTAKAMTVAYAPPEKFLGMAKVGPEGDAFSLGVMLVELLTGDLPWSGMGGAYVRPDSPPIQLPTSISPALTQLIQRCVAFEPAQRPTPKELKEAAERYLSTAHWAVEHKSSGRMTEVVTPKSQSKPEPAPTPPINTNKNNTVWWVAGGILAMLLIILVIAWPSGAEEDAPEPMAENSVIDTPNIVTIDTDTTIGIGSSGSMVPSSKQKNPHSVPTDTPSTAKPTKPTSIAAPNTPKDTTAISASGVTPPPTQRPNKPEEVDWTNLEPFKASNGKYGYRHTKTKATIIMPIYIEVLSFSEGLGVVRYDAKEGYVDKLGREVIPLMYDGAMSFSEGLGRVCLDDKCGFIDKNGRVVIPLKYSFAFGFTEGTAKVTLNGKSFYINKQGECVKDCP